MYLAGKGDGNVRLYEFFDSQFHMLNEYRTNKSGKAYVFLPKLCSNVINCEIACMLKVTVDTLEEIPFVAPRKQKAFFPELFPDCISNEFSQTA